MPLKQISFDCCEDCPKHDLDPNTMEGKFWGQHVCLADWDSDNDPESKIKIIEDATTIPEWCKLNDAKCPVCGQEGQYEKRHVDAF